MNRICQRVCCTQPAINRGKYCSEHRTDKSKRTTSTARIVQERLREFERNDENERKEALDLERKQKIEDDRAIRREQEEEFQQTMQMDRERLDQIEFEKMIEDSKNNYYTDLRNKFESDTPTDDICTIRIQLPTGHKINQKFSNCSTLRDVRDYLDLYFYDNNMTIINYDLVINFTFRKLSDNNIQIRDLSSERNFMIYLQNLDA